MERIVGLKHFDLYLSDSNLNEGIAQLIQYIKPEWKAIHIKRKIFTEGLSNILIGVYLEDNKNDMVLVRIYGEQSEYVVDRDQEVVNMQTMYKSGLCSPVYCTFINGVCYAYLPGIVLDEHMVRDPHISRLNSQMMARMHTIKPDINSNNTVEPILFKGFHKHLVLIPEKFHSKQNKLFNELNINTEILVSEVQFLERHLKAYPSPVVFCHNDLLVHNIIINYEKSAVSFIDFEYSGYNYQAFDIANHFIEFAGIHTFDPNQYPNKEFQLIWIRHYLEEWHRLNGSQHIVSSIETEVESLYELVRHYSMAPHLYWAIIGLIQTETHSTVSFDYMGYAIQRLREYYKQKKELNLI